MLKRLSLIAAILLSCIAIAQAVANPLDFEDGKLGLWHSETPEIWYISPMTHPSEKNNAVASLALGEEKTGTLTSPVFTITSTKQVFYIAGADGTATSENNGKTSFLLLKSHPDGKILRKATPPGTHIYTKSQWETADLIGQKVYLELVDGNPKLNPRGFAWIGLSSYHQDVSKVIQDPIVRDDIYGVDIEENSQVSLCRTLPFNVFEIDVKAPHIPVSTAAQGETKRTFETDKEIISIGTSAQTIYLLGMTNGWDYGVAHWGEHPEFWEERIDQIFVGSQIGEVEILYSDGKSDIIPLKIGATAWFVQAWAYAPMHGWMKPVQEPFASRSDMREILDNSLKLKEQPSSASRNNVHKHFYLAVKPRNKKIESIIVHNNPKLRGTPLVSAVSLANPSNTENLIPFGKRTYSAADLKPAIKSYGNNKFTAQLKKLAKVLYTTEKDLPKKVDLIDFPANRNAAKIHFKGDRFADMLSNVWVANLSSMADKFSPETGRFQESGLKYPWYGGYNGIGTWAPAGIYRGAAAFPRCSDHYASLPLRLVDNPQRGMSYIDFVDDALYFYRDNHDPKKGPPNAHMDISKYPAGNLGHWAFTIMPSGGPFQINEIWGDEEMDGHGATAVVRWYVWRTLGEPTGEWLTAPRENIYGNSRWDTTRDAAEFICWLMDYTGMDVIYSEGESTGWGGRIDEKKFLLVPDGMIDETDPVKIRENYANADMYHPYPTYTCMVALQCSADIAEAVGDKEMAQKWHSYAERIKVAMIRLMARGEQTQRTWLQSRLSVLPSMQDSLVPAWFAIYRNGLDPKKFDPEILQITQNTLKKHINAKPGHKPVLAMGYGIGWLTHAALALDSMDDADKLLINMAKYAYDKNMNYVDESRGIDWRNYQWIIPEGSNILPDGSWYRIGDLGNGANQGPALHALEICAGVDDTNPQSVKFIPRVPKSMEGIGISNFPVMIPEKDGLTRTKVEYDFSRDDCKFSLKSEKEIPVMSARLGPYSQETAEKLSKSITVSTPAKIRIEESGTNNSQAAWWVWVEDMKNVVDLTIK